LTSPRPLHQHAFPSGLVLLAEPIHSVRSAAFSLLVPGGSVHDPADRLGSASLLSEWVMRGAGPRDSHDLLDDLDALGVSHGSAAGPTHLSLAAATLGSNLLPALEIFADVVLRPTLDGDEFEPIRELALQSLRSLEDDPATKVVVELRRRHYPEPWGRPTGGTPEGVANATADSVRALHHALARPAGAILAVAGSFHWPALRDAVERLFHDWTPHPEPAPEATARPAGGTHLTRDTRQIQIALALPAPPLDHPEYYLARAAAAVLGGYSSARLFREVREKRGLCYSIYAGYDALPGRAAILTHAGTSAERAQETLDLTLDELQRLRRDGVDADELDTMRAGLKSALVMQQESTMARAAALASDWYHLGRVRTLDEILANLDAISPRALSEHCAKLPLEHATLVTLGPRPLDTPLPGAAPR
jgi:predicted Zn-dependent peptidase